jgi:hypothetical protein
MLLPKCRVKRALSIRASMVMILKLKLLGEKKKHICDCELLLHCVLFSKSFDYITRIKASALDKKINVLTISPHLFLFGIIS